MLLVKANFSLFSYFRFPCLGNKLLKLKLKLCGSAAESFHISDRYICPYEPIINGRIPCLKSHVSFSGSPCHFINCSDSYIKKLSCHMFLSLSAEYYQQKQKGSSYPKNLINLKPRSVKSVHYLSISLRISIITKRKGPNFAQL